MAVMSDNPFSAPPRKQSSNNPARQPGVQLHADVPRERIALTEDPSLPPLQMEEKSCRTCQYYHFSDKILRGHAVNGECRRNAPCPGAAARAQWPVVDWDSWCGEWINGVSDEDMVRMARDIGESIGTGQY